MTQLEHAGRRTTVVTTAIVAAIVAAVIVISALLIVPALSPATLSPGTNPALDEAGRVWQQQRLMESADWHNRMAAAERAGLEWQLIYEQTNPNR